MRKRIILFWLCVALILLATGVFVQPAAQIIETVDHAILADIPPVVMPVLTP